MQIHTGKIMKSDLTPWSHVRAIRLRLFLTDPLQSLVIRKHPPWAKLHINTLKAEAYFTILNSVRKNLMSSQKIRQNNQSVEIARLFEQDMKLLKPSLSRANLTGMFRSG